jgi:cytochrome c peroxidase
LAENVGPGTTIGRTGNRPKGDSLGLFNLGFEGWRTQFWDGRVHRTASGELVDPKGDQMLEGFDDVVALQAMLPVTSRVEMRGFPEDPNRPSRIPKDRPREIWSALMDRLLGYDGYWELFAEAYPSKDLDEMTFREAAKALAQLQKSAFTSETAFDEYLRGDEEVLTREQNRE